ncbi:MAG: DEAD/DEAH box helicase [Acidobacteriota bacterium]|nr:DEAD/DEAH box helicase [Acidobacteriota bacterium]MDH3785703.1 DEAD/DEAH box helicase [Acidobacteriota bacterium]
MNDKSTSKFAALGLAPPVLAALEKIGYEQPSPIQAQSIPYLLEGRDLLGVAQTGTGKTAAFALPLLTRVDLKKATPQILVLTPTRELAIQVSEAFQRYASQLKGFRILPIYGGQEYGGQLRQLSRGVHAVVGTPGRVMDHLSRGSLKLDGLKTLVLDEADEMLRMGFLDDVEWILQHVPDERQTALFSATMPRPIQKVAQTYLTNPREVRVAAETVTVEHTEQRACMVRGHDKLDALTRLLETVDFDGMLVFVRTRTATVDLAERIEARGFACAALNGDMSQPARERTVNGFKTGKLDILIATDVAARGLDVPRISHVVNFDIPHDIEAYIHRIGRTGRAGRDGTAITFVTARESRLLHAIERATRSPIEWLDVPGSKQLAKRRIEAFKQQLTAILTGDEDLDFFRTVVKEFADESSCTSDDVAAALTFLVQQKRPLQPPPDTTRPARNTRTRSERPRQEDLESYKIQVGRAHGATAGHIVGAITNEAGLQGSAIGRIKMFDRYSIVDLPRGLPAKVVQHLRKVRILQQPLLIQLDTGPRGGGKPRPFVKGRKFAGKPKPRGKARPKG